ncbi:hypothetical protein N864_01505 [Intrasporangium chromatireducens Q5-1]|uniref:Uncharacterized protein n=1 Tax=Intrasporangium chromatireducens Q5-1 TaxID=584657 RepID=W9GI03_9MICO|nr:hypothetical protein N864_01505 [Intrasporangium chromatireducens Q5-1]
MTRGERTIGWVRTTDLEAGSTVESAMTPLSETRIVAASAPMSQVLSLLDEGFVFTVRGEGLSGFITPSDLERHAARAHFYLLVAEIEMQLSSLVHHQAPESAIIAKIERRTESQERWEAAKAANRDSRPVEYLYLSDLKRLFLRHVDSLPDHAARETLDDVVKLRTHVMHPTKPMLGESGPSELARLDLEIRALRDHLGTLISEQVSTNLVP